jgi:hypothetical protein
VGSGLVWEDAGGGLFPGAIGIDDCGARVEIHADGKVKAALLFPDGREVATISASRWALIAFAGAVGAALSQPGAAGAPGVRALAPFGIVEGGIPVPATCPLCTSPAAALGGVWHCTEATGACSLG